MLYSFLFGLFWMVWYIYIQAEGFIYLYSCINISLSFDSYSINFFLLLCMVSASVMIWSYYYMDSVEQYPRFLLTLLAFLLSMVALIFMSNLFMTLVGWDCLGITSFLLVIYYKNRKSLASGMLTALSNRVGDCFFFLLLGYVHSTDNVLGMYLLFVVSITKSAQFPFTAWLPAAMAAPTPVSALVHSSTLVTAGIYLLIRYCSADGGLLCALGCLTLSLAGYQACQETDIKKIVAMSTLSQLGVMMVALGSNEKSICFFHLMSHAFFKALLFMCIGVYIHSTYGTQDFRSCNYLTPTMCVTVFTYVATFSLLGFLYTTGYYSKDMILEMLYVEEMPAWVPVMFLVGITLTTCYSLKMLLMTNLISVFTTNSQLNLGAFGWSVKMPVFFLGIASVVLGTRFSNFCRPITVVINTNDKVNVLLMILIGVILCLISSKTIGNFPYLGPVTQNLSNLLISTKGILHIDKGWVTTSSMSMTSLSYLLIPQYTTLLMLSFASLLLFFFV